jgi:hypothetical protein
MEELPTKEESPDVETAFIVYKTFDGSFHATPALDISFIVDHLATKQDIKTAMSELLESMHQTAIAEVLLRKLTEKNNEDS